MKTDATIFYFRWRERERERRGEKRGWIDRIISEGRGVQLSHGCRGEHWTAGGRSGDQLISLIWSIDCMIRFIDQIIDWSLIEQMINRLNDYLIDLIGPIIISNHLIYRSIDRNNRLIISRWGVDAVLPRQILAGGARLAPTRDGAAHPPRAVDGAVESRPAVAAVSHQRHQSHQRRLL